MFKPGTVLILGAGASHEAGLPIGARLAAEIAGMTNIRYDEFNHLISGSHELADALRGCSDYSARSTEYLSGSNQISAGVRDASSIDNFVDIHAGNDCVVSVAKLSIALSLLEAEERSTLFVRQSPTNYRFDLREVAHGGENSPRDTWYQRFFEIATEGVRTENLDDLFSDVAIISFNYDRTLELFLIKKLQNLFGISANEAQTKVAELNIVRPFGSLGSLPELPRPQEPMVEFGSQRDRITLSRASNNLKTYSEFVGSETEEQLSEVLGNARKLVFLGCAYHTQNLIMLESRLPRSLSILGTALSVSSPNRSAIESRITGHVRTLNDAGRVPVITSLTLEDSTCATLLSDWKETLRS